MAPKTPPTVRKNKENVSAAGGATAAAAPQAVPSTAKGTTGGQTSASTAAATATSAAAKTATTAAKTTATAESKSPAAVTTAGQTEIKKSDADANAATAAGDSSASTKTTEQSSTATTAKDTATTAKDTATTAKDTATTVKDTATTAKDTATTAKDAKDTATTATATNAKDTASTAKDTASTAKDTASTAKDTATTAKDAEDIVTYATATNAKDTASTAKDTASTAKDTASTAKDTASTAKDTASTAKDTATTAKDTATTAKDTATTTKDAKDTATTAKDTATTANVTATAAVKEIAESALSSTASAGETSTANATSATSANPPAASEKAQLFKEVPQESWLQQDHAKAMGATILEKSRGLVCFRVWGVHIEKCFVSLGKAGAEQQRVPMTPEGDNLFACQVENVTAGQPYHFVLISSWNDCFDAEGHELHRRDPYARHTDFDSNTCFVTEPSAFKWDPFAAPSMNKLLIYEMHVGTFAKKEGKSQFEAVAERLQYIKDLGYNAVELMPVVEFGGKWGYNPRVLFAPHSKYGSPEELRTLVNKAHLCGLAVIFDVVLNRGSVNLNSLWNYDGYGPHGNGGIYFEGSSDSGWGKTLALDKKEVREMVKAAALALAIEYNADGLRIDAVHEIPWEVVKELTSTLKQRAPKCCLIAEVTPENPAVCNDAGFDSCWVHASYYDAIKIMRNVEREHHISMLKGMINGHRGFKKAHQSVNSTMGSHDQCGNRHPKGHAEDSRVGQYFVNQLGGRDNWHARAQCRMWFAVQALSRPLPMTFMGTETLQGGWWHIDKFFDWNLVGSGNDDNATQMMKLVTDVHKLRLSSDNFTDDKDVSWCHEDSDHHILAFTRMDHLVVVHIGEQQWESQSYGVKTHWKENAVVDQVFNSQAESYGGWEASWSTEAETGAEGSRKSLTVESGGVLKVNLPKWSVIAFRLRK